jgi:hypothetical protein
MPKRSSKPKKRPDSDFDPNQLAALIVQEATKETPAATEPAQAPDGKDPAAVSLGRRGGLKGGPARAKKLSAKKRKAIAKKAAKARWSKAPSQLPGK